MREFKSPSEVRLERLVHGLSVFTFVLLCWTLNRVLIPRENCIGSDYIGTVHLEGQRIDNCAFESRLRLGGPRLSKKGLARLRRLEDTSAFRDWIKPLPALIVNVSENEPRAFEIKYEEEKLRFRLRLGAEWIDEGTQVRRAVAMAVLRQSGYWKISQYQLEILADFMVLSSYGPARWTDGHGDAHDWAKDVRLATAASTFAGYCQSPFRSLAHERACAARIPLDDGPPWGLQPVLSRALALQYSKLPLARKMRVIAAVRRGLVLPTLKTPAGKSAAAMVLWFDQTLKQYAGALQMRTSPESDVALGETMRALGVESPVRWDVTFDLRSTPRWRDILGQLEGRARFRPQERALVFTPEGEIALPSGLPVEWDVRDIDSGKHVLIACQMPGAPDAVKVRAPRFFARQTCGKLDRSFWD